jgi:Mor family transcriptional regulator
MKLGQHRRGLQAPNAKPERNAGLLSDRAAGMTYAELGRKYAISVTRVRQIVRGY